MEMVNENASRECNYTCNRTVQQQMIADTHQNKWTPTTVPWEDEINTIMIAEQGQYHTKPPHLYAPSYTARRLIVTRRTGDFCADDLLQRFLHCSRRSFPAATIVPYHQASNITPCRSAQQHHRSPALKGNNEQTAEQDTHRRRQSHQTQQNGMQYRDAWTARTSNKQA